MSRIDDALRRARGEAVAPGRADTHLDAPWQFGEDVAPPAREATVTGEVAAPERRDGRARRELPARSEPAARGGEAFDEPRSTEEAEVLYVALGNDEKVVGAALEPAVVEEYRKLAASLHQAQVDRGLHVLLVASAVPGEGKSLTAANLALTLSMSYSRRTLLIDADLRRPSLHGVFRHPVTTGLSEALDPGTAVSKVSAIQLSPLLALLPAGRPVANPVPLLSSARMSEVVRDAREHFDWIIIDTPPVAGLTDANLLATIADASLLVIHAGRTPHAAVEQAVQALGKPRIFGVVLNRAEPRSNLLGGYDSYGGYTKPSMTQVR